MSANYSETAIEKVTPGVSALVEVYAEDFTRALPRHIDGPQWIRNSLAALRKDKDLYAAANNNTPAAMRVLMEAARLGHVPGTKEYYLIPRGNKELGFEEYTNKRGERKKRARQEVTGIEGYLGIISRIYRAGAVQSVIVELVKSKDRFTFNPGLHDRPEHEVDWFGDRGDLVGVYAYAVMHDRAISKVVIMSLDEIHEHRARSETWKHTWSREYSPWTTDFEAMVRKTAVRQLEKWVPTSTEYREQQFRLAEQARAQEVKPEPAPEEPIEAEVVGEPEGEAA